MTWPEASFLAWVHFDDLGDDPADVLLESARLALSSGPAFGYPGIGHARINYATSAEMIDEIVARVRLGLSNSDVSKGGNAGD